MSKLIYSSIAHVVFLFIYLFIYLFILIPSESCMKYREY